MAGVGDLPADGVREALRLLGREPPHQRAAGLHALRECLSAPGGVRGVLEGAPTRARAAFDRLAAEGPASVEELLGRGWWGQGLLPPPLDWLQRRALVIVAGDALVHATDEARAGYLDLTLDLVEPVEPEEAPGDRTVHVEQAACVVVAPSAAALDPALRVRAAVLRAVAPTVAVSNKAANTVMAALRSAGVAVSDEVAVDAVRAKPALPAVAEDAVGPRAVRALVERAVAEQRQVRLRYFASSRGGAATDRVVDPWSFEQDLLRGYCHLRSGERTFALDRIGHARLLPSPVEHRGA